MGTFLGEIARSFKGDVKRISAEALDLMVRYDWPGNIRELKDMTEVCLMNLKAGTIDLTEIPEQYRDKFPGCSTDEKASILSALFSTKWNKSKAAQKLHWSRMTLYRKLARYHIGSSRGDAEQGTPVILDSTL